jgi:tetratricopeptide (TPR) repeat protein
MFDWLRPLLLMFYAPTRGMAEVRERAPLAQSALLALLALAAHNFLSNWSEISAAMKGARGLLVVLSVLVASAGQALFVGLVFVPVAILFANLFERRASVGLVIRQEYAATASTVFYALAAAGLLALPLALISKFTGFEAATREALRAVQGSVGEGAPNSYTDEQMRIILASAPRFLLLLLMHPFTLFSLWALAAVREVFRLAWWLSAVVVVISTVVMFLATPLLLLVFGALLGLPFLVLLIFVLLRGYLGEATRAQRSRASFKQNLEAATLNPADASAHYNLGLIHLQRKELQEARARFERAVAIDPEEVDAHFQLGRIARAEGRLADAIAHYGEVVSRDDAHAQHEIWREVGATYVHAGQFPDARDALERFLAHRPSDPEGLYLMGRALFGMGLRREAVERMQACIEAVKTAPAYKYRTEKRWLNEAQQFLRSQA